MSARTQTGEQADLFRRLGLEWWIVGAALSLLCAALILSGAFERAEKVFYDNWMNIDSHPARDDIVLVLIDNSSLDALGQWPWPRTLQARVLETVLAAKPASVSLNILLPGETDPDGTGQLRKAIQSSDVPVYLGMGIENAADEQAGGTLATLMPAPQLLEVAAGVGHTSFLVDKDGLVRRAWLHMAAMGQSYPNLAYLTATRAGSRRADSGLLRGDSTQPSLIPYAGSGQFRTVPVARLLADPQMARQLHGRHVLIGVNATGIETRLPTPLSGQRGYLSGTLLQAHMLNALLDGRTLIAPGAAWVLVWALLPLWVVLVLMRFSRPTIVLPGILLLTGGYILLDYALFSLAGLWLSPVVGLTSLILAWPIWEWRRMTAVVRYMGQELDRYRDEGLSGTKAIVEDRDPLVRMVSQLGQALRRAKAARQFVGDVIDQLPAPALVLENSGQVILANSAANQLFASLEGDPLTGTRFASLVRHFDMDRDGSNANAGRGTGQDKARLELTLQDGSNYELRLGALRDENDLPEAWIVLLADITRVKAALRQREEIMQLLTHDIRSPLASILASITLAGKEGADDERLVKIRRYANRALQLAEEFVVLAKANSAQYVMEPLSLRLVLEDAVDEIAPQAKAQGLVVEIIGDDEPWLVEGDYSLLLRAIVNLLSNALKYGASGGRVTCAVFAKVRQGRRCVEVSVQDWGDGMPEDAVSAIFTKFRQLPGGPASSGGGFGLAVVDAVARGHGGMVYCVSRPGEGATFTISLPAMDDAVWAEDD